ncbi:MAG: hypothetical protein ABW203_06735 [Novosphingobium sp.]
MRTSIQVTTFAAALLASGNAFAQESPAQAGEARTGQGGQAQIAQEVAEQNGGWDLSGFADVSVKNDYVTPRGLVVTTSGGTVQILNGVVAVSPGGVALHAGTWTDINPGYSRADGNITAVNEFDFFFGVSGEVAPRLKAGVEYVQFISGQPSVAFQDERNIEFSLKYSDGAPDAAFTVNPYAKLFWAFDSKSSTVVLGKAGGTFDVELGAVPTYKTGNLTLSAPTWITVGPKTYWGSKRNRALGAAVEGDNFGVVSTGLKGSVPLGILKGASAYAHVQYYHLINDNLVLAKALLNSGDNDRDHVVFGGGLSFAF